MPSNILVKGIYIVIDIFKRLVAVVLSTIISGFSVVDDHYLIKEEQTIQHDENNDKEREDIADPHYATGVNIIENKNYTQDTSFDMKTYFRNLYTYSPTNSNNTCSFVSLIQVMSYYDTFYNDDIIPEQYDRHDQNSNTEQQALLNSPGVSNISYNGSPSFYQFCMNNINTDLQSRLILELNKTKGNIDSNYNLISSTFDNSMHVTEESSVLNSFYGNTNTVNVTAYLGTGKTNSQYEAIIKNAIDQGKPVVVQLSDGSPKNPSTNKHAVVAYDYDENGIYANFGWGAYSTHFKLLSSNPSFDTIYGYSILDFSSLNHKHSNNYVINNEGRCGCNLSDKINLTTTDMYNNIPPTIYWMKNIYDTSEYYTLKFRLQLTNSYYSLTLYRNQITLSSDIWAFIILMNPNDITIEFERHSSLITYTSSIHILSRPTTALLNIDIDIQDFALLNTATNTRTINTITKSDGSSITISSSGCYQNSTDIVMTTFTDSLIYSEIDFTSASLIRRVDIDLALYSDNEYIEENEIDLLLYYYDLDNDLHLLTRGILDEYSINSQYSSKSFVFPYGINRFGLQLIRNEDESNEMGGRIKLNDVKIYQQEVE